jgi:hypothetical protein
MKNDEGIAINSKINAGCRKINWLSLQDNRPSLQDKAREENTLKQLKQRLKSDVLCGIKSFECLKGTGLCSECWRRWNDG